MSASLLPLAVLALLLVVHGDGIRWWWAALSDGSVHAAVVVAAAGGVVADVHRRGGLPRVPARPHVVGVVLIAVAGLGQWVGRPLQVGVVDAAWVWLTLAGVVGVWGPRALRQSAAPLLLGALVLPRMGHLEALVGVPLRLATAHHVATLLGSLGLDAVDQGAVLMVEGRATAIDLPCSGVRSLWTGLAFVVGAAWLDGRRFGPRLAGVAVVVGSWLVVANALRVAVLVVVDRSGWPGADVVAAVIHEPLGVMGFATACAVGWGLLRLVRASRPGPSTSWSPRRSRLGARAPWVGLLTLGALVLAFPRAVPEPSDPSMAPPTGLTAVVPPSVELQRVADQHGRLSMSRFDPGQLVGPAADLSGEVVVVWGTSVRAQHRPDICLRASGATVDVVVPGVVGDRDVRTAVVDTVDGPARVLWWFQSTDSSTGSHAKRLLEGLWSPEPRVLVSVLIRDADGVPDLADPAVDALVDRLADHAADLLSDSEPVLARLEAP